MSGLIGSDGRESEPVAFALTTALLEGVKLMIATPVDGDPNTGKCALGYATTLARILAEHRDAAQITPAIVCYPSDLVRSRSRAVRYARDGGFTHVWWLDDDNIPKPGTLGAMLASGHDWVGCPYPKKRMHWERMGHVMPGEESEWHAYDYSYHRTTGPEQGKTMAPVTAGCMPVERLSIGCTLTSLRALDAMWDFFKADDWFTDVVDGKHFFTVALFNLLYSHDSKGTPLPDGTPFRALYSEDYSGCERYNMMREARPELGFSPIQMLVSHPADHLGTHMYRGSAQGLVYAR